MFIINYNIHIFIETRFVYTRNESIDKLINKNKKWRAINIILAFFFFYCLLKSITKWFSRVDRYN